jgi:hypothetical protein
MLSTVRSVPSKLWGPLGATFLVVLAAGCGPGKGNVSGKVYLDGKEVPGGYVNFFPEGENATARSSPIAADGSYAVSGVPLGKARISVQGVFGSEQLHNMKTPQGLDMPRSNRQTIYVPTKYSTVEQSGLTFEVKPGSQSYDIQLEDR